MEIPPKPLRAYYWPRCVLLLAVGAVGAAMLWVLPVVVDVGVVGAVVAICGAVTACLESTMCLALEDRTAVGDQPTLDTAGDM